MKKFYLIAIAIIAINSQSVIAANWTLPIKQNAIWCNNNITEQEKRTQNILKNSEKRQKLTSETAYLANIAKNV